ncbi:SusC/RagA family TonB-linked outer membrane protein [Marinifilum fragile]|uniref:SusC/RagA family TonB-linked outer membrane protein n=1 Tax=Marinifilum fragile TaxID=570161 RepID=UPI002AA6D321|nr:SusC/RagA family TonB-linked outer membrane protein [Marinifilum fragile]
MKNSFGITSFFEKRRWKKTLMRMKLLTMLMLVGVLQLSANVKGQNAMVNMSMHNANLIEFFSEIADQTDYEFLYNYDLVLSKKTVSLEVNHEDLKELLEDVLHERDLDYQLDDNVIIISERKFVAPVVETTPVVQEKTVKGKVTDEAGAALPGVSILVKGTSIGTATDVDGNYTLRLEEGQKTLVFSFIGMVSQEIAFTGQEVVNVTLFADTEQMAEVVVTGYQTIAKERATGSYDKVDKVQINKPSSSVADRLVGTVVGLHKRLGTQYEDEGGLQIRGVTSLGANSSPLIVVDGFAIEGDLESINPNDIESVTVLKDAAAASIWGARSANGVIVITTKKAKKGDVKVEVSSWVKFESKMDLDYANPLASSSEVVEYEKMGFNTGFFGGSSKPIENDFNQVLDSYNTDQYYSSAVIVMNENRLGFLSDADMNATLAKLKSQNNKKQIKDNLLASPFTQQHNVIISGGSENLSNTLSLLFESGNDYFKGNDRKKYNINYRNKVKLADWLDFNFSGMFQYNDRNNNGVSLSDIQAMSPYDMLLNEDGSYADVQRGLYMPLINRFVKDTGSEFPYENWGYNPIQERRNRDKNFKSINSRVQAGLKVKLLEGLTFDTKFQYEIFKNDSKSIYSEDSYEVRYNVNKATAWTIGNPATVDPNLPKGSIVDESTSETKAYNIRNQINFARTYKQHAINFIAGTEITKRTIDGTTYGRKYGFNEKRLTYTSWPHGSSDPMNPLKDMLGQTLRDMPFAENRISDGIDKYFSVYGNLAYTYNDKYTLSGSYRTDASNLISSDPKSRYSPFWSIGAGWQLSKEDFMKDLDFVDRLTLRATYGFNGNVNKETSVDPLISYWGYNSYTGTAMGIISNYGNPSLSWEKTGTFDLGFDFSLFRGRLFGKIDVYNKKGEDLISMVSIPAVNGDDSQSINAVEMYNRGIEISVGTKLPIKGNQIVWTGNLNFAYNKNKITSLYKDDATLNYRMYGNGSGWEFVEGYNAHTVWGMKYGGMHNFGTAENPDMRPSIVSRDGKKYVDFSGYGPTSFVNKDFVTNEGTYNPPVTMGFTNHFKIHDFDLSFIMTGYFGHIFRRTSFNYPSMSAGKGNINEFYKEVINGDPNKIVPVPTEGSPNYRRYGYYVGILDYLTVNADNIRIEEINLTYNMPKKALNKIGLKGLSFYAQANNVGVITFNKYNQDPVYPKGSIKPGVSYTFGCKFNF